MCNENRKIDRLFVIDDCNTTLMINSLLIKKVNTVKDVILFESGLKALSYIDNSSFDWPEIILCDINMPEMTGWQFFDQFKLRCSDRKKMSMFCVLSNSVDPNDHKEIDVRKDISMFLTKPLDQEKLNLILSYYKNHFLESINPKE